MDWFHLIRRFLLRLVAMILSAPPGRIALAVWAGLSRVTGLFGGWCWCRRSWRCCPSAHYEPMLLFRRWLRRRRDPWPGCRSW